MVGGVTVRADSGQHVSLRRVRTQRTKPPRQKRWSTELARGENRPTAKQRDREAARKQPLVVTDRAARRPTGPGARRQTGRSRQTMITGGRPPPAQSRDKAPVRHFVRDTIDADGNVAGSCLRMILVPVA